MLPLPIVTDKRAEAPTDRILFGNDGPARDILVLFDGQKPHFIGDKRAYPGREVDIGGGKSAVDAAVYPGPGTQRNHRNNLRGDRAAQNRQVGSASAGNRAEKCT